jgi:hydrogenase maturation protease
VSRPVVIGFGNTLRKDDGAGVYAAERVAAEVGGVDVFVLQELTPELALSLSGRDLVVFVDASTRASELTIRTVAGASGARHPDHALLPDDIVSLCGGLFPPAPRSVLSIEVPAFDCAFGETMTPAAERMVDLCVDLIRDILSGKPRLEFPVLSPN